MRSAIINLDFKLDKTGRLVLLEMADGINDSGYQGYDAHFTDFGENKQMARAILKHLTQPYQRIHFIVNNATTIRYFQPAINAYSVIVHEKVSDFFEWWEEQSEPSLTADVILIGDDAVNIECRHAKEIKQLLQIKGIQTTVLGGDGMVRLLDSKVVFGLSPLMRPTTQWLCKATDITTALEAITSERIVLKPDSQREGIGVVILPRNVLLRENGLLLMKFIMGEIRETQASQIFDLLSLSQKNYLRELSDCRKYNPLMPVIMQAYVSNQPIEKDGISFDATGRMVVAISENVGAPTIELIAGYWKLPRLPIAQGGLQETSLSVVGNRGANGSVLFSDTQRAQIESQLPKLLPWVNRLLATTTNAFFQQWKNYPPIPELQTYLVDYCVKHGDFEKIPPELLQGLIGDNRTRAGWFIADRLHAELLHMCNDPGAGTCYPALVQFLSEYPADSALWNAIRAAEIPVGGAGTVPYYSRIINYLRDYFDGDPLSAELKQVKSKLAPMSMQHFTGAGSFLFQMQRILPDSANLEPSVNTLGAKK